MQIGEAKEVEDEKVNSSTQLWVPGQRELHFGCSVKVPMDSGARREIKWAGRILPRGLKYDAE